MEIIEPYPKVVIGPQTEEHKNVLKVIDESQIPQGCDEKFTESWANGVRTLSCLSKKAQSQKITKNTYVYFSEKTQKAVDYLGFASEIIVNAFHWSRKEKPQKVITITLDSSTSKNKEIIGLAQAKMKARGWALGRGDVEGTPQHFIKIAQKISVQNKGVNLKVIQGDDLVKQGFRLLHAVGRASCNPPALICLEYKGSPTSEKYLAFVGKGVCFDTGGINLKSTPGLNGMHLDKHGACNCLAAFQQVVKEQLKINVVCVMGMVQNSVSSNAYRPHDIIQSRKGLTVEIGNTDAEGRLVLADAMNWVQETYKVQILIEQSTLTGAIRIALHKHYAGLFCNEKGLINSLERIGKLTGDAVWNMPWGQDYLEGLKGKHSDLNNIDSSGFGGSCTAASFLSQFVNPGVKWAHIDIAGPTSISDNGVGFGARLLLEFARESSIGWA